jgi:uncharacterized protein (DUF924 family)
MPLMHSEDLADQDRSVALFDRLLSDAPAELRPAFEQYSRYARAHRDIVARFGRFPHRNAVLRRTSTPEETDFLQQPNSSF